MAIIYSPVFIPLRDATIPERASLSNSSLPTASRIAFTATLFVKNLLHPLMAAKQDCKVLSQHC